MMSIVAVVGAGELGGTLAHKLAVRGRFSEIRLIDPTAHGLASGKALDITQASSLDGFDTSVIASDTLEATVDASVIVLADLAGNLNVKNENDSSLAILKQLSQLVPKSVIVCPGDPTGLLIESSVNDLGIPQNQILGTAPGALVSTLQALVALEAGGSATDVSVSVLGFPPDHLIVQWNEMTLGGHRIENILSPLQVARLRNRTQALWPPGPYALASSCTRVCEAITDGSRRIFYCFVSLNGEFGARGSAISMPVYLGQNGIERILKPSLSVNERVQLENALEHRAPF